MALDTYILTAQERYTEELRSRTIRLMKIRWFYLIILSVSGISLPILAERVKGSLSQQITMVGIVLLLNLLIWLALNRQLPRKWFDKNWYYKTLVLAQVSLDLVLAAYFTYLQGGVEARTVVLLAVPIVAAGILIVRSLVFATAVLAALAYVGVIVLYHFDHPGNTYFSDLLTPMVFYPILFGIIAALVSSVTIISTRTVRQESYDELLSMLTHQLRHPASATSAIIDVMEKDPSVDQMTMQQRQLLGLLKKENLRLLSLISNLLEAARLGAKSKNIAPFKPFDIVELVRSAAETVAMSAHRSADLVLKLPEEQIEIMGHPEQFQMALDNIINNALIYSHSGTKVTVEVHSSFGDVRIIIKDKGSGMSKKHQKELFEPFVQVVDQHSMNSPPKAGLGLYVSKRIIERHRGTLTINSKVREGTEVIISLKRSKNA